MDRIAVRLLRGDVVESTHRASVAVCDRQGRLAASFGDPKLVTFVRSSIKPLQALPLIETGAADHFGFTPEEIAITCASHNGEERHVGLAQSILSKIGLGPEALLCGAHAPYNRAAAKRVGEAFTALHNNCSGKHAGMLATTVHNGWDPQTYLDPSHPLQQVILKTVSDETGVPVTDIGIGVDGCSAPNFALPLRAAARAYARLMAAEGIRGGRGRALARLRDASLAHPEVVAGEDRLDTRFMRAFGGDVWVKAGGEACFGMGIKSLGLGVCLKIEDGAWRAVGPLLFRILEELGVARETHREALQALREEPQKNWAGRLVGRLECDVQLKFSRPRATAAAPAVR